MPDTELDIRDGDVVLVRARARATYKGRKLIVLDFAEAPELGGPGFRTDVHTTNIVHSIERDPPDDPALVPPARR